MWGCLFPVSVCSRQRRDDWLGGARTAARLLPWIFPWLLLLLPLRARAVPSFDGWTVPVFPLGHDRLMAELLVADAIRGRAALFFKPVCMVCL